MLNQLEMRGWVLAALACAGPHSTRTAHASCGASQAAAPALLPSRPPTPQLSPCPLPPHPPHHRFATWTDLNKYQNCEHGLKTYISQLQPYKKTLPPGVLRDFKC